MKLNRRAKALACAMATGSLALVAGCGGAGAGGGASGDALADMKPITISYSVLVPKGATAADGADAYMDYVEEHSEGKIKFERYYAGALVPATELLSATSAGVTDMAGIAVSTFAQDLPIANWMLGLGALPAPPAPLGFIAENFAAYETYMENSDLLAEFEEHNVIPVSSGNTDMWGHICTSNVATPEDAKGKRIVLSSPHIEGELKEVGFTPQGYIPAEEIYEALQRGVVDCHTNPSYVFADLNLWDVAKYATVDIYRSWPGFAQIMNQDLWDSLPSEAQDVFREGSSVFVSGYAESVLDVYAKFLSEGTEKHGMTFNDPAPFKEVLDAYRAEDMAGWADKAPDGVDADLFIESFESSLEKWTQALLDAGVEDPTGMSPVDAAKSGPSQPWKDVIEQLRAETEFSG